MAFWLWRLPGQGTAQRPAVGCPKVNRKTSPSHWASVASRRLGCGPGRWRTVAILQATATNERGGRPGRAGQRKAFPPSVERKPCCVPRLAGPRRPYRHPLHMAESRPEAAGMATRTTRAKTGVRGQQIWMLCVGRLGRETSPRGLLASTDAGDGFGARPWGSSRRALLVGLFASACATPRAELRRPPLAGTDGLRPARTMSSAYCQRLERFWPWD